MSFLFLECISQEYISQFSLNFIDGFELSSQYMSYWKLFWQISYRIFKKFYWQIWTVKPLYNLKIRVNLNSKSSIYKVKRTNPTTSVVGYISLYIPFLPTVPTFAVRETDISRHNGGPSGAPLKPLRDDSALRALSTLKKKSKKAVKKVKK